MKIKKVDNKPMVIHTKKKAELHTHKARHVEVKGANVLTSSRGDKGRTISGISKNRLAKTKMSERGRKGMSAHLRSAIMEYKEVLSRQRQGVSGLLVQPVFRSRLVRWKVEMK